MPSSGKRITDTTIKLVSTSTAAITLGVSKDTIRRMISRGELPGYKVGRSLRLNEADVLALITPIPTVGIRSDRDLGIRG